MATRSFELIRHGATHLNSQDTSVDRLRGWKDVPLSKEGRNEAQKTGRALENAGLKHILTSDLCRASETASIISQITGVPILAKSKGFRPWDVGQFAGQISKKAVPILGQYASQYPDKATPGGESFNCFRDRAFLSLAAALHQVPDNLGIVSHYRFDRLLKSWQAAGFPEDGSIDVKTFNSRGGEPPGGHEVITVPLDRLEAVGRKGAQNASVLRLLAQDEGAPQGSGGAAPGRAQAGPNFRPASMAPTA